MNLDIDTKSVTSTAEICSRYSTIQNNTNTISTNMASTTNISGTMYTTKGRDRFNEQQLL